MTQRTSLSTGPFLTSGFSIPIGYFLLYSKKEPLVQIFVSLFFYTLKLLFNTYIEGISFPVRILYTPRPLFLIYREIRHSKHFHLSDFLYLLATFCCIYRNNLIWKLNDDFLTFLEPLDYVVSSLLRALP